MLQDDFEHFLWTVVFLAMGGIALGKGVTSSGLLDVMDEIIRGIITDMSLYAVVLVLSGIVLVRMFNPHRRNLAKPLVFHRLYRLLSATRSRVCCWFLSRRKSGRTFLGAVNTRIYSSS